MYQKIFFVDYLRIAHCRIQADSGYRDKYRSLQYAAHCGRRFALRQRVFRQDSGDWPEQDVSDTLTTLISPQKDRAYVLQKPYSAGDFQIRLFEEPLVPIGTDPTPDENTALAGALFSYEIMVLTLNVF